MRRLFGAFLLVSSAASAQPIYDFLLKGGRVIDPANHRDGQMDVAIVGAKIVRVAPNLPVAHARVVVDVSGYMVTPGLIDINTHLGELKPDYNTLPYGVTTAVEVGATCATLPQFKKEVMDQAKVRVLASIVGGCGQDRELVARPVASPAVLLFSAAQKNRPDTISSGMGANNALPRINMIAAMSIYLNLGLTAEQIIERVTANPAKAIKRPELGTLSEGGIADIAVLEVQPGKFGFVDSAQTRLDANRRFHCVLTMRNGAIVWDSEGLSVPDTIRAGPYTNFK